MANKHGLSDREVEALILFSREQSKPQQLLSALLKTLLEDNTKQLVNADSLADVKLKQGAIRTIEDLQEIVDSPKSLIF